MVDIASSHIVFSFMDGSSGYNQIKMAPEDERNTAFRSPIGIFYYKVMPFGLKNAGATYQWAMTRIFDDLIHNQVECYIDDLVVKSKVKKAHIYDLRIVFEKAGVGLVFITPDKGMMHFSYHLSESCTNNEAKHEALITGLELVILMEIKEIKIFGDSQLVINQIAGTYKVLNHKLLKYHQYTCHLLEQIPIVTMYRIPRGSNSSADALAKLAKEFACLEEDSIPIEVQGHQVLSPIDLEYINKQVFHVLFASSAVDEEADWRQTIIEYFQEGKLPHERSLAHQIKKRALSYVLVNNTLYR
ncbi:RNA-directed DNA polymerase [Dendrobium catenatum]|uniref:RNA-directed DNA polymerase n=1 Tax=Dendrobium catenatum TaxID=906689 RepID=A0A2I0X0L4_9ASPA|nr:RNA-directed DNA polymerase [Dendrobium catenatum]